MKDKWILNLCPFLHFDNARTNTYEHNVSIAAWNIKSIIDYLEVNPSHKFAISQVTLLEGFERLFPNYWDKLHQSILEGRVEIVGGTYVAPDFVIPDGESIIRQFTYGMNFFQEKLGVSVRTGWAPDSYGHNAQMPQILKQCGLESYYFYRGMPFKAPTEFIWMGPDGSRINAIWLKDSFDSAEWLSENILEAFSVLMELVEGKKEASISHNLLLLVGGVLVPPLPHLADICEKWNDTFQDMKSVIVTPAEFTEKSRISESRQPAIAGELSSGRFSPIASGGLSSRIDLKILNRELETLLYLTELFLGISSDAPGMRELDNIWRMLLFNQDHNIIRGTCADKPAQLAEKRYRTAINDANEILEETVASITEEMNVAEAHSGLVVFNPVSWERSGLAIGPLDDELGRSGNFEVKDRNGDSIPYQIIDENSDAEFPQIAFIAKNMPPLGYEIFKIVQTEEQPSFETNMQFEDNWIETDRFILEFDDFNGSLNRIRDKELGCELLRDSESSITFETDMGDLYRSIGSQLSIPSDEPSTIRNSATIELIESGPVFSRIESRHKIDGTTIVQQYTCYQGLNRIDATIDLDSRVRNKRIRLTYPLNILSHSLRAGSQFYVKSTVPEYVKNSNIGCSESISAIDWVSCTGPDVGILLSAIGIHDFEYKDGNLACTLLRSVDQLSRGLDDEPLRTKEALQLGKHSFMLSLIPHDASTSKSELLRSAMEHRLALLTYPLEEGENDAVAKSILSIDSPNLILSCFKPGNTTDEIIVRLYESEGVSDTAVLTFHREIENASLVDLLEREIGTLPVDGNSVSLHVDRFAIVTLRIKFLDKQYDV